MSKVDAEDYHEFPSAAGVLRVTAGGGLYRCCTDSFGNEYFEPSPEPEDEGYAEFRELAREAYRLAKK